MIDDISEIATIEKKNETMEDIVKKLVPGTRLRNGLDEILASGFGALIVLGTNIILESIIRGGFKLDIEYNSQRLFELSKMDGAIILSNDLNKIVYSNIHLMPDKKISSLETGIRHRSAEQTSKQTGLPVVAISHRRKKVSLFYKNQKYVLQDIGILFTKANHSLRILQNYRTQIDSLLDKLSYYELNHLATVEDILKIIQKYLYFKNDLININKIVLELGDEGKDIKQTVEVYNLGLEEEILNLISDYAIENKKKTIILKTLENKDITEISDLTNIVAELGLDKTKIIDEKVIPRGYRILAKIPKLSKRTKNLVINKKGNINEIMTSKIENLIKETDINEAQAKILKDRLKRLYESVMNKTYR